MGSHKNTLLALLEVLEQYSITSLELFKLKILAKSALLFSTLVSNILWIMLLGLSFVMLNIAGALWLGELLGKYYVGFLCLALFDALLGLVIYLLLTKVKLKMEYAWITHLIN